MTEAGERQLHSKREAPMISVRMTTPATSDFLYTSLSVKRRDRVRTHHRRASHDIQDTEIHRACMTQAILQLTSFLVDQVLILPFKLQAFFDMIQCVISQ